MARSITLAEIIAIGERFERRLLPALARAPIVEVTALVDAAGVYGDRAYERTWTMHFDCRLWRIGKKPLREDGICFRRPATHQEYRVYRRSICPGSIIHLRARVVDDRRIGGPYGLLMQFDGVCTSDIEMNRRRSELQGSNTIEDRFFGTLVYDKYLEHYEGIAFWGEQPVRLWLEGANPEAVLKSIAAAHALWEQQPIWQAKIARGMLKSMLPLKNRYWLDAGEPPLSPARFQSRLNLELVQIKADDSCEFWYQDGYLFLSHSIVAYGSLRSGLRDISLVG